MSKRFAMVFILIAFAGVAVQFWMAAVAESNGFDADLSITKTDNVTSAVPGQGVTYTIVAANAGPDNDPSATVDDTFPAALTCTYTSVAADGATGNTAAGSGNLAETLSMPVDSSVTYTVSCSINPAATGTLSNTATITASVKDPTPGNNSATDNDTVLLTPPTVTTTAASAITFTTASTGGNVTANGGAAVTARGVCRSTSINPTLADTCTTDGSGTGAFVSSLTGLTPDTTYHVRAYATNIIDTAYGGDVSFTSLDDGDGVPAGTEDAAPNGGDANDDGTPDSSQGHVSSIPSVTGAGYITVVTSGGCAQNQNVQALTEAQTGTPDNSHNYPWGLISVDFPCTSANVRFLYHGDTMVPNDYWKYGLLSPGFGAAQWYRMTPPGAYGTVLLGGVLTQYVDLVFNDGAVGDGTPVDGTIFDQGGPASALVPAIGALGMVIFITLAGLGGLYYLRRKRAVS